jgi:transcriptional antiterminator RfaH
LGAALLETGMYSDNSQIPSGPERGWFCLRSQPKREHIAAAHLRRVKGVEVFNPRLRIRKATRRGIVTFIEALFPNYLFARFNPATSLDSVKHAPSVSSVVHFGNRLPLVPDDVIADLKASFGEEEIHDFERHVSPGDAVTIGEGPFFGIKATVLRVMAPHLRVEVLMELLGRTTPVIVNPGVLVLETAASR